MVDIQVGTISVCRNVTDDLLEKLAGTSRAATLQATATQLVGLFGRPSLPASEDGKVDAEWIIEVKTGYIVYLVTVFAYQQDIFGGGVLDFSVGSKSNIAAFMVKDYIEKELAKSS